jgi:hypothetical protein
LLDLRWRLMSKMVAEFQIGITLEFSKIFALFLAISLYFCQQHESRAYIVKLVKNDSLIQNGGTKPDFLAKF